MTRPVRSGSSSRSSRTRWWRRESGVTLIARNVPAGMSSGGKAPAQHDGFEFSLKATSLCSGEPHIGSDALRVRVTEASQGLVAHDDSLIQVDDRLKVALHAVACDGIVNQLSPTRVGGMRVSVNRHRISSRAPQARRGARFTARATRRRRGLSPVAPLVHGVPIGIGYADVKRLHKIAPDARQRRYRGTPARVAKLADALDLGSSVFGRGGSSPPSRTTTARHHEVPGRCAKSVTVPASAPQPRAPRSSRGHRPCRAPRQRQPTARGRARGAHRPG